MREAEIIAEALAVYARHLDTVEGNQRQWGDLPGGPNPITAAEVRRLIEERAAA